MGVPFVLRVYFCRGLDLIGKPLLYLQMGKQSFFSPKEGAILLGIPSS